MSVSGVNFEALTDFKNRLIEIDILCEAAKDCSGDEAKYSTFNKAALLLIAGKFESFVESIVEEFIYKINSSKMPADKISVVIRLYHSFYALREFQNEQFKGKQQEAIELLIQLGRLWATTEMVSNLPIENKFNYGKHGEKELAKIFERVGIPDLFEKVKVLEPLETVSEDQPVINVIDFRGIFNSVCSMRNNILHDDETPSLNTEEIVKFRNQFEQFAVNLESYLLAALPA